ncbi:unnamed protein product [Staurois parvus]|uniref:Uncharacterized protein n=1 Tax=Staurois parvus TaxID=386267 RepID=A0ABN9E1S4_9NEOB|nr:unnamed protein product [Staurois parvus]
MMSGSDILLTTIHVIPDWPISDHMNRDLTQRSFTDYCNNESLLVNGREQ